MPRQRNRTADERNTFSKATLQAIAAKTAARVESSEFPCNDPSGPIDCLNTLVGTTLFEDGIQFRFTPGVDGRIWAKACIRTRAYPRHYLLASFPAGTPFTLCLEGLVAKVQAFQEGTLRPSPDKWNGE